MRLKLILIRGIPGTGKTTLANKIGMLNTHHYEADMFFGRNYQENFDVSLLRSAHEWCRLSTKKSLLDGYSVIVSNTFTTEREIRPYIELGKEFGAEITIYELTKEYGSIHNVPAETMNRMRGRFIKTIDMNSELLENVTIVDANTLGECNE